MPRQDTLAAAKRNQSDEFYTLFEDINKEINAYLEYNPDTFRNKTVLLPCDDPEWSNFTRFFAQNFERLGLKKLISTSYAVDSKPSGAIYQPTLFETKDKLYDESKTRKLGKIFTLTRRNKHVDINDLKWNYLESDGDFRSEEVKLLRDEADIIVTNPPFSLFSEFLSWITEANKQFLIIGNINCITYKDVFNLIQKNKAWLGNGMGRWISGFIVPENYDLYGTEARRENGKKIVSTNNCLWLTNLEHGRRHQKLSLMTKADNLRYNNKLRKKLEKSFGSIEYPKYDNYDAIEVPFTECIPSDYDGIMGVPITFLNKYNPEQFKIVGCSYSYGRPAEWPENTNMSTNIKGKSVYKRLFIKKVKV